MNGAIHVMAISSRNISINYRMEISVSREELKNSGFATIDELNQYLSTLTTSVADAFREANWTEIDHLLYKILDIKPEHFLALVDLADSKRQQGELEQSYDILTTVIQKQPEYVDALDSMAATCNSLHKHEEALSYARQSLSIKHKRAPPSCNNTPFRPRTEQR